MAEWLPPKWPDNYQKYEVPAIIRTAESLWICKDTWKVVYDTKTCIATIFVKWDTREQTAQLNETFKKAFIQKLQELPNYQWGKIQEAIDNWTIEIKKIPNKKKTKKKK